MYHKAMRAKKEHFRSDIAILRGFSIALVMLCHFDFKGFSFGFIGVDIFFVISGFLISQSLYREFLSIDNEGKNSRTISLSSFYLRRLRRLLPAALTVVITVNMISFFLYNTEVRDKLISDSKWAFIFLANVAFLRSKSNYFQMGSQPSFLEHYWSLSVEEQFYAIWPLLFLFTATFKRFRFRNKTIRFNQRLLVVFSVITLSSYLFLQYGFTNSPVQAYFSLFSRAWELAIGGFFGILAYQKRQSIVFSKTERISPFILSILIAGIFINQRNWASIIILPVLATGFFLFSGNQSSSEGNLPHKDSKLWFKFSMYLGAISYSLYLVHWPIYVVASRAKLSDKFIFKIVLIIISISVAHLLWKYVEQPFQKIPISKKLNRDTEVFKYLQTRRKIVNLMILVIVGSLYFVTFPYNSSQDLKPNEKDTTASSNVRNFAFFESQLVTQSSITPSMASNESSSAQVPASQVESIQPSGNLANLIANHQMTLKASIKDVQLSSSDLVNLTKSESDYSDFELSICPQKTAALPPPECLKNPGLKSAKKVLIIGDSKMAMLAGPIGQYFENKGWQVQYDVMFGCLMSRGFSLFDQKSCSERTKWTLQQLSKNKYDLIVFSEYPAKPPNTGAQESFYNLMTQAGDKVLLLGTMTKIKKPSECLTRTYLLSVGCSIANVNEMQGINWSKQLGLRHQSSKFFYIDTTSWFCVLNSCPVVVNGTFVFRDGVHLASTFVKSLDPIINATLDSIVNG
jgi:peptidoglycan/LPS O-acetylase OafA/YrhL